MRVLQDPGHCSPHGTRPLTHSAHIQMSPECFLGPGTWGTWDLWHGAQDGQDGVQKARSVPAPGRGCQTVDSSPAAPSLSI